MDTIQPGHHLTPMSEEAEKRIQKIFADPQVQSEVVDIVVRNKPPGWSRKSQAPYYNERYALQLKDTLDAMMASKQDAVYSFSKFPGKSINAIYARVNQSVGFLRRYMDPTKKYSNFLDIVNIRRDSKVGVLLEIKEEFRQGNDDNFKAQLIQPKSAKPIWKAQVDEFLENATPESKPLLIENLALAPDEITELKIQLHGLSSVISSVTTHSIKIIKVNAQ